MAIQNINRKLVAKRQRGEGLFGGLLYLIIIGIAIFAAIMLFRQLFAGSQIQSTQQDLLNIQGVVRDLYAGRSTYGTTTISADVLGPLLPDALVTKTGSTYTISNRYGGAITVAGNSTPVRTFTITFDALPKDACIKMALKGDLSTWTSVGGISALPMTSTQASGLCTTDAANSLAFISR